jgi:hypothetical protein
VLGRVREQGVPVGFREVADEIGANALNVPDKIWKAASNAQRWSWNKEFLDAAIKRGDVIRLANSYSEQMKFTLEQLKKGVRLEDLPFYSRELLYLEEHGYRLVQKVIDGKLVEYMEKL